MSDTAQIITTENNSIVTIVGDGALDLTNAQMLRDELYRVSPFADDVIVDLRSAFFIDTAILEYLAKAARTMLERGKRLRVLVAEQSHPLHVLNTVGFSGLMDIESEPLISQTE